MSTLTVTSKGQVTLRKDVLQHLGVTPGHRVRVTKLPGGRVEVQSIKPSGSITSFFGCLAKKTDKVLTIEDMNEVAAKGWSGKR